MTVLADHSLWLALPAFAPAVVVAGVVAWVAMRDRRAGPDDGPDSENPASTEEDDSA
ncbi:hypothetical protein [Mycolicibacterium sp. J2]|uniref:hypothetical protein n=1 Tax=Mycolicibacterium sp. J2 TaxID=2993511 RepID=UPI00224AE6FD|nr:hypothetical protein [Mycolicibacterium sp. J2]MCX2712780.1 hypothetical protein [Mycolicibacterium sp. J2]